MQRLPSVTDPPASWEALKALAAKGGRLVMDIGANTGQCSQMFAPLFERVVAFEPCQESYTFLVQEAPENVTPYMVAISDHPGGVVLDTAVQAINYGQLVSYEASEGHPEWGQRTGERLVPCTTIDEWVGLNGIIPDLVKVDTEGHEYRVLLGGYHTRVLAFSTWFVEVHSEEYGSKLGFLFPSHLYRTERIEHDIRQSKDHFYFVARPVDRAS